MCAARRCAKWCACECAQSEHAHSCVCRVGASRERAGSWRRSVGARRARRAVSGRARATWGRATASVGEARAAPPDIRGPLPKILFSAYFFLITSYPRVRHTAQTSKTGKQAQSTHHISRPSSSPLSMPPPHLRSSSPTRPPCAKKSCANHSASAGLPRPISYSLI